MSSKSTPYTLTTADVESYLATRRDDDPVGTPCHAGKCLLAQAFLWKYPGIATPESLTVDQDCITIDGTNIEVPLSEDVQHYMDIFDGDTFCGISRPFGATVSKREWLEAKAQDELYQEVFAHGQ